ncbi:MAG: 4a-hydroxytetrahydrobiopterin dehydratase [Acidimicrobiales bacterium]
MAGALSEEAVNEALATVPVWSVVDGRLHRELEFADFSEAFGFMARVAMVAEKLDHHPDWSNSWNKVVIDIVNHAAGGISEQCFRLAAGIDATLGET